VIAVIDISNNFSKKLDYHTHKMQLDQAEQRATILESSFISLDKKNIEREVAWLRAARPRVEMYTYHTSLSFHPSEKISDEKILSIAKDYMEASGLNNSQHMIFRHHDTEHPHVHILANMINYEGQKLNSFHCYKNNMRIVEALEKKYELVRTAHEHAEKRSPSKQELEMIVKSGRASEKMVLQEMLADNLKQSADLDVFIRQCQKQQVEISFWKDQHDQVKGMTFFYQGLKMRGSALGELYNAKNILNQLNYEQTRDREIIREANSRTAAIYGEYRAITGAERRDQYARDLTHHEFHQPVPGELEHPGARDQQRDQQLAARATQLDPACQEQDRKRYLDPADTDRHREFARSDHAARDIMSDAAVEKNLKRVTEDWKRERQLGR
jgi:hypothetical protein